MKRVYKNIKYIFSLIIIVSFIFNNTLNVTAEGGGTFGDDVFSMDSVTHGYYMVDDSSMPTGKYFYYKYADGKAWYCTYQDALAMLCNKSYGISMNAQMLAALVNGFDNYAFPYLGQSPYPIYGVYKQSQLAGYALNGISGCKLVNPQGSSNVATTDSSVNNFIFIYVQDYIDDNFSIPDYIEYRPSTVNNLRLLMSSSETYYARKQDILQSNSDKYVSFGRYYPSGDNFGANIEDYAEGGIANFNTKTIFYGSSGYNDTCSRFSLNDKKNVFSYTDIMVSNNSGQLYVTALDTDQGTSEFDVTYYTPQTQYNTAYTKQRTMFGIYFMDSNYKYFMCYSKPITIYKNAQISTMVQNHTYAPTYNTSNTTNNYDSSSENNSTTFNTDNIDNSTQDNDTIYNDQSQEYYDNSYYNEENNYYIDNSQVTENNTTIINNYYGDQGGGGGDDDDDDDDDPIWSALLKAIADFFKKLGELIATVLTGIVTILTSILEAIATIVTDFTGITDFLGQIFAWLPSEIITLMTLGLTTALFAAFLTWFKK